VRAPALVLAASWLVATTVGPTADVRVNDLFVYRSYAGLLADGLVPYRDFGFEYPPLALAPIAAGGLAGLGEEAYAWTFGALMLAAMLVVQRAAAALAGERGRAVAWALVALPLAAGALVRTHFDLVPVALAVWGLALVAREGPEPAPWRVPAGFALLALGTATKLFPALLAAAALAWLLARGRRREGARGAATFAAVLALACAPFALVAPGGFADQIGFHLERPVQIESTPASVLWALGDSHVTGHPVRPDRFKSNGLAGGSADIVALAFAVVQLAALAAALALARRDLVLGGLAALLAFVALGKVLSPQFLLWVAPLAAVAWARGARAPAACVAAAVVLTQLEFPARYLDLVAGDPALIALVAVRNVLLVAALSLLLARVAAPARWRRPVPAPSSG
jgi:uncharacterized membrane protein